jgi:hypothetical protein
VVDLSDSKPRTEAYLYTDLEQPETKHTEREEQPAVYRILTLMDATILALAPQIACVGENTLIR